MNTIRGHHYDNKYVAHFMMPTLIFYRLGLRLKMVPTVGGRGVDDQQLVPSLYTNSVSQHVFDPMHSPASAKKDAKSPALGRESGRGSCPRSCTARCYGVMRSVLGVVRPG